MTSVFSNSTGLSRHPVPSSGYARGATDTLWQNKLRSESQLTAADWASHTHRLVHVINRASTNYILSTVEANDVLLNWRFNEPPLQFSFKIIAQRLIRNTFLLLLFYTWNTHTYGTCISRLWLNRNHNNCNSLVYVKSYSPQEIKLKRVLS